MTGSSNFKFIDTILICKLCNKPTDLATCEVCNPTLLNTLTDLPDHNKALWKCDHCGGWN